MKIAVANDKGAVASHFGHCETFEIFEVEDKQIIQQKSVPNPGHKPGFLPNFLHDQGVNIMIAGGIGMGAVEIFGEKGIIVIAGASGSPRVVVEQYLQDKLDSGEVCQHNHN